jgi:hypothetical protein
MVVCARRKTRDTLFPGHLEWHGWENGEADRRSGPRDIEICNHVFQTCVKVPDISPGMLVESSVFGLRFGGAPKLGCRWRVLSLQPPPYSAKLGAIHH